MRRRRGARSRVASTAPAGGTLPAAERARQHIAAVALVVRDYDEALAFYVGKLGFTLVEDTPLSPRTNAGCA